MNNKQQLGNQVEVRVRQTAGGPQIFVDGKPTPPHWCWGREIIAKRPVSGEWRAFCIPHTPAATIERAEVHFAFQPRKGVLEVRNFSFGSARDVSFRVERDAADPELFRTIPVGRLERGVRYDMSFEARGEGIGWVRPGVEQLEDGPYHYQMVQVPPDDPELCTLARQARLALAAGVRFITFYTPNCWMPDGEENWEPLDRIFRKLVAIDKDVLVIPRVTVNAPEWWRKAHPGHEMVLDDGSGCGYAAVSSRAYRRDAAAYLEKACRHMMETWPRNFAGIHHSGQNSNEWFYKNAWTNLNGYDPQTLAAFREWLAAHGDPDAATAIVPAPRERRPFGPDGTPDRSLVEGYWDPNKDDHRYGSGRRGEVPDSEGVAAGFADWLAEKGESPVAGTVAPVPDADGGESLFWDPVRDRRIVAFNQFQQEDMCDFVAAMSRACRKATEGKKLVACFYGYSWEISMMTVGPAASGHYGVTRLLESAGDSIDILSAPFSYRTERSWLGSTAQQAAVETLARHGVLWVAEDDTVTHLDPDNWHDGYGFRGTSAYAPDQTADILRRNQAVLAVRGIGSWWMDLRGFGWFDDPSMWRIAADYAPFDRAMLRRTAPHVPDVATFVDEESMMFLRPRKYLGAAGREPFTPWGVLFAGQYRPLSRLGTSYGQYLLADALERPIAAKLQILPIIYADDAKAAALAALRESQPDATRLWCWAPAALSPRGGFDLDQMRRVTGFTFRLVAGWGRPVRSTAAGLAAGLPETWSNMWHRGIAPRFAVEPEPGDEVWATWEDGSAAVVVRRHGSGCEIFSGAIETPRAFLAAAAKLAGVFVSLERPERASLWRTEGALCLQALQDGENALLFPASVDVRDGLTGEVLGEGVTRIPLTLRKGEVRAFLTATTPPARPRA